MLSVASCDFEGDHSGCLTADFFDGGSAHGSKGTEN